MDEPDVPQMQYITNTGISIITHCKHHHHVVWLISNGMRIYNNAILVQFTCAVRKKKIMIWHSFSSSADLA